jgi:hypothetical protein
MVGVYGELGNCASRVELRQRSGERAKDIRAYRVRRGDPALMTSQTADRHTPREPCIGTLG